MVTPTGEERTERPFSRRHTTCAHPLQPRSRSPPPPLRAQRGGPWRWRRRRGASSEARRGDGREEGSARPEPLGAPETAFPKEGRGPETSACPITCAARHLWSQKHLSNH